MMLFFLAAISFATFQNQATKTKEPVKDFTTTATVAMNYPYINEHPDYWEMGTTENILIALNAIKAFEKGNIPETMKYFGDSIPLKFDGSDKKMSADSPPLRNYEKYRSEKK
ncbi:MAG: hypothetical protein ABIO76_11455 [Ginsengibacter sp.]